MTVKEFYGNARDEETESDAELSDPDGSRSASPARGRSPARRGSASRGGASASASASAFAVADAEVAGKVNHSKSTVLCVEFLVPGTNQLIVEPLLSNVIHIECTRRESRYSMYEYLRVVFSST